MDVRTAGAENEDSACITTAISQSTSTLIIFHKRHNEIETRILEGGVPYKLIIKLLNCPI